MSIDRDHNIDVLRALSIAFVLFYHINPFRFSVSNPSSMFSMLPEYLIQWLNRMTLLAVPTFILISLILLFRKLRTNVGYISKRIFRLIKLFVFWFLIQVVVFLLIVMILSELKQNLYQPSFYKMIMMGGPSLPYVGDSVFYFLFVLILLTILAFLFFRISVKYRMIFGFIFVVFFYYLFGNMHFMSMEHSILAS